MAGGYTRTSVYSLVSRDSERPDHSIQRCGFQKLRLNRSDLYWSRPRPAFSETHRELKSIMLVSNNVSNAENHNGRGETALDLEGLGVFWQLGMVFG